MPGLAYDEGGSLAAYFGITILSLFLLPMTFRSTRRAIFGVKSKGKECDCSECKLKAKGMKKAAKEDGLTRLISRRTIFLVIGWTAFAGLAYYIRETAPVGGITVYNPFEILGLPSSSDEKSIKKHYKKLSLQFHPDKIKLGPNQTQEEVDAHFVDLTKAYKSLTDEVTRENLVKYGHPDGQQPREEKIAIPAWVVDGNNGMWALAAYGLMLAGGLPWLTGKWWNSQKSLTRDGALNESAELFFRHLREDTTFNQLLALLASAIEYRILLGFKGGKGSKKDRKARAAQTEALEAKITEKAKEMGYGDVLDQATLNTAPSKRAAALLWSQLLRVDDISNDLLVERRRILAGLDPLIASLLSMASIPRWLNVTSLIFQVQSRLVQGVPSGDCPIAQLPGVDITKAREAGKKVIKLQGEGWQASAGDKEIGLSSEAAKVAEEIPQLKVAKAMFEVDGEDTITPNSQIQFICDLTLELPASAGPVGDETAFAHAPRWPQQRKGQWWVYIGDPMNGKIVVPPQKFSDIPVVASGSSPTPSSKASEPKAVKLQFPAPPNACELPLRAYFVSDTYVGSDKILSVTLKVIEDEEEEEEEEEEDISDPEEDTIAGALAMARGQKVKSASDHHDGGYSEEDESSGTDDGDGDSDSSDSDSD